MANSQTFVEGFGGAEGQITTLSQVQGSGLSLPPNASSFINIRRGGKLETLFLTNGNDRVLYTKNKPQDLYLKGLVTSQQYIYKNPNEGQRTKIGGSRSLPLSAAIQDATRIRKFLGSSAGIKFTGKQLILQGFQSFDETKVYNPASPLIAAIRSATFGLVDRPTRHIDTSNILTGLLGGTGLSNAVSAVGQLLGSAPPQPSPPRSSVASAASGGLGLSTLTSLVGGGDNSSRVVTSIARDGVKDLLRGNTATNAYNNPRYQRWMTNAGGNFFSRLITGVGRFFQNNTLLGGILPPKQPWPATYRADEQTYEMMLNAGKLFDPTQNGIAGGGILSGLLNSLGFGKKADYSLAVNQRFYGKSKNKTSLNRLIIVRNIKKQAVDYTKEIGVLSKDKNNLLSTKLTKKAITPSGDSNRYSDVVKVDDDNEYSDQILNYKTYLDNQSGFKTTFSDQQSNVVKDIIDNLDKAINDIGGANESKYSTNRNNLQPLQFAKFSNDGTRIGTNYLKQLDPTKLNDPTIKNDTYQGRFRRDETLGNKVPTRLGEGPNDRYIYPTNNVDYVNSLQVLNQEEFTKQYSATDKFGIYGPDIIKFYFYDIVNQKYIPFNATVKSITDNNNASWETVEYLGRPDKLFYYKGFERQVNFNFTVNAHSVKELMPMWQRINYLVGLTRPANYTLQQEGGYMVPPMVQLTLGDFYKNHFVVITSCNVTIPDDTSWETIPEEADKNGQSWYYGPNKAIQWQSSDTIIDPRGNKARSKGRVAQFPRTAEISVQMNVLEKDRPYTGKAIWGDAPVSIVSQLQLPVPVNPNFIGPIDSSPKADKNDPLTEFYDRSSDTAKNNFSKNIRYDNNWLNQINASNIP
jgi:hypothetical protein